VLENELAPPRCRSVSLIHGAGGKRCLNACLMKRVARGNVPGSKQEPESGWSTAGRPPNWTARTNV